MLAWRLAKSVEESLNHILLSGSRSIPLFGGDEGHLNVQLL